MSVGIMPVSTEPNQRFEIILTDKTFTVTLRHSPLTDLWTFDLSDANKDPIVRGRTVVLGANLIEGISPSKISGLALLALNTENEELDADFDRLTNGEIVLHYADSL